MIKYTNQEIDDMRLGSAPERGDCEEAITSLATELTTLRAENADLKKQLHHKNRALSFIANNPRIDNCVHMVLKQVAKEALK